MSARPPVKPGDVLGGKYKVERILGVGGMGIVVAAKHKDLGQLVAVKFMLKEAMADKGHAERFLREAKAAVQLKSPHTARVLDVGRLKNDEPYMVMEYLEGRDLDAELQARGPMPPIFAVSHILQACEALAEAHGLGMIHRDVKLKNMFLTSTLDGRPLVKMLDFGLAKQLGSRADVSLTATNSVFGSPQYMSPEQMKSAKDVDHRSDIWSLGVCLYELLTGRVPFDGGVAEVCAMVLKDPVPMPSSFALGIPADLEDVVLKCLEKEPSKRFQSVPELAYALQRYTNDEYSALRIFNVMQTAQRVEHPTVATSSPPVDRGPTLNAWDSAVPNRPTTSTRFSRGQIITMLAFGVLGALGCVFIIVTFKIKARPRPPIALASPSTESPAPLVTSAALPPSAEPTTVTAPPVPSSDPTPDAPAALDTAAAPTPTRKAPHSTARPGHAGPAKTSAPSKTATTPGKTRAADPGDHM